jgi:carboxymethylenebutenolidase
LNQQIKDNTEEMANLLNATGVSPDLYRGRVGVTPDEASHLMHGLDWAQAVQDVQVAVTHLRSTMGCTRVFVLGYCMGGALTLKAACHVEGVTAASCFYGIPPGFDAVQVKCPLQCHFGDRDQSKGFSDKAAADGLKAALAKAGKSVAEFHQYPDGDHAFMNKEAPAYPYNEKVANEAKAHLVSFFATF